MLVNYQKIITLLISLFILISGCSSNCLKQSDIDQGANLKFAQTVYSMTDKDQLQDYVIDNFSKFDQTSWQSDILLLQIADYLDQQGVQRKVGNQLRYQVLSNSRQRNDLSLFHENVGKPEVIRLRYLLAYASYKWGESLCAIGDSGAARSHLEAAYRYCPSRSQDLKCKNIRKLLKGPKEFRVPYAKYLYERGEYLESWKIWYEIALDDDEYIEDFKLVHKKLFPKTDFKKGWKHNKLSLYPEAKNFRFATSQGDTISLSQYFGKWLLLDFWATGCSPCVTDLPNLDSLSLIFEKSKDKNVKLITILQERDFTKYNKLNKNNDYSLLVGLFVPTRNEKGEWERFPYNIKYLGYKMIITPEGNYFEIPLYDYPKYVERYLLSRTE